MTGGSDTPYQTSTNPSADGSYMQVQLHCADISVVSNAHLCHHHSQIKDKVLCLLDPQQRPLALCVYTGT